jgi:hypothetical protein
MVEISRYFQITYFKIFVLFRDFSGDIFFLLPDMGLQGRNSAERPDPSEF